MKRTDLIREFEKRGCVFIWHGGKHDWYQNPKSKTAQPIPRHKEMKNPAAETAGRQKLNICFQCHSRLSGIFPDVRDRKKDSGQARMTETGYALDGT